MADRRLPVLLATVLMAAACAPSGETYPLVLRGGRVMDPATGLDSIRDVAIRDGKIAAIWLGTSSIGSATCANRTTRFTVICVSIRPARVRLTASTKSRKK